MAATSRTIKVLHFISDLSVGGAEMMLYKLLSEMDGERFGSAVVSLKGSGPLRARVAALGVPVYTLAVGQALPSLSPVWRLHRLLRRVKPDVIQGWMPHGNLAALLAGAIAPGRVPVLWNIRQSLDTLDYEKPVTVKAIKLGAWLSHKPDGIIYNSRTGASQHEAFGYRNDRTAVIYNGFDTKLFAPSRDARRSVRAELGLAEETVLIGLIGRYHAIKNHENFLRAAAALRERYADVQFVLSGRGIARENHALLELIRELGLSESVHLLGERQDTERITAALDVAASASYGEGFPNVVGEAMASAVPCVVTDVSDLPWIVKGAGLVVPRNCPVSMARAFTALLELGSRGREALGRAGRARVMKHFRLDAVAAQYGSLYESLLARKKSEAADDVGSGRPAWANYSADK